MKPLARLGAVEVLTAAARGGMGAVFEASHPSSGQRLALKVPVEASTARALADFREEGRALARLDHPRVLRIFDLGELPIDLPGAPAGTPYHLTEWVDGGTLHGWRPTSLAELALVLLDLLDALAHVHARDVLHRDLKPANILCEHADGIVPRLADFGVAITDGIALASLGHTGSVPWMAPEQVLGLSSRLGPWTDLYGLGACAWTWLTGSPPFGPGTDLAAARSRALARPADPVGAGDVPVAWRAWLGSLLEVDPARRPPSARAAAHSLLEAAGVSWQAPTRTLGRAPIRDLGQGLVPHRRPALVGHEGELARIGEGWREVVDARRAVVIEIAGASGTGRSAVAHEALARLSAGEGVPVARLEGAAAIRRFLARPWPDGEGIAQELAVRAREPEAPVDAVAAALLLALRAWSRPTGAITMEAGPTADALIRRLLDQRDLSPTPLLVLVLGSTGDPRAVRVTTAPLSAAELSGALEGFLPLEPSSSARIATRVGGSWASR